MRGRKWSEIKTEARQRDPRREGPEAQERRRRIRAEHEASMRGFALGELRRHAGLTQGEVAARMGVSQARVSQIEHGKISGLDVLRVYVDAVGGEMHITVDIGALSARLELPPVGPPVPSSTEVTSSG